MSQWVQHKSGQGEKWEVVSDEPLVYKSYDRGIALSLPKAEYILCDPPERWVDVTGECEWVEYPHSTDRPIREHYLRFKDGHRIECDVNGYRLRKVELDCHGTIPGVEGAGHRTQWAFIVERKEP